MKNIKHLAFTFVIFLALILSACTPSNNTQQSNDANLEDTFVYKSPMGDVTIPSNPKAIVSDYYVGELLNLNAPLIGADLTYVSSAWDINTSNITHIGESVELVYSLNPDLIITMNADRVPVFSDIAPTVCLPYGTFDPEELVQELATITNTKKQADNWLVDFNNKISELKNSINGETTVSIVDFVSGSIYLYGENYGRGGYIIYNKLGLKGPEAAESDYIHKPDSYLQLTLENMSKYIGDVLLFMSETGTPEEHIKYFTENPLWQELPAVKNNRVYHLKSEDFWYADPLSMLKQIDILKGIL
jgi:iron complex transport system substrate-binding protein